MLDYTWSCLWAFALVTAICGCTSPHSKVPEVAEIVPVDLNQSPSLQPSSNNLSGLDQVDCWFEDPNLLPRTTCYTMHVPEDHDNPHSRMITFPVVRLSNPWGSSTKTPVLHLGGGGPGNPMGFDAETVGGWLWDWYQEMSLGDNRDLYLIDPRGVGLAQPVLVCEEYIPAFLSSLNRNLTIDQEVEWNTEVNQQCAERLVAQGINVSTYNSRSVARDVDLLRQSLQIERWNLYGVSYGSRYALTLARDFPETVESMVLDATVFPNVRYMDRYATSLYDAYRRLIGHCSENEECLNALGDPEQRFWQLVRSLKQKPVRAKVTHPQRDQQINLVLNADRFLSVLYNALYDAEQFSEIPQIIASLENNELGNFEQSVNAWLEFQTDADYGDASAAAHFCYEESPFIDYDKAIEAAAAMRPELSESAVALLEYNRAQCERWPVAKASAVEGQPIVTSIPTLFLHGALDPVLPVEYLEQQLDHFSQADYEVFDEVAHSIVGVHPCGESMASAFYNYKLEFRGHVDCAAYQ
ncbi:MAG: alpha/beta hydrolase [bacterium]